MQVQRIFKQLVTGSGDVATIDITSSKRRAQFTFDGIDTRAGNMWNYVQALWILVRTKINQPASGAQTIPAYLLYQLMQSLQLKTDDLGSLYRHEDLTGAQLGLIAQYIGNGYRWPFQLQEDTGTADKDIVVPYRLPIGHKCFTKGHQTGVWSGFFEKGILEIDLAAADIFDTDETGVVLEATTDIRVFAEMAPEPEARIHAPWVWRVRETAGGQKKHTIRDLGGGEGLKGNEDRARQAFLAYLSSAGGLGGATTIDKIGQIDLPNRKGQQAIDLGSPFNGTSPFLYSFVSDLREPGMYTRGSSYPYIPDQVVNGSPADANALFMPYYWPDPDGQQVSKLAVWGGDYNVNHTYAYGAPSDAAQWLSLEGYEYHQKHKNYLADRMGIGGNRVFVRKTETKALRGSKVDQAGADAKMKGIPTKIRPQGDL